jgi:hypothetical protein
MQLVCCFENVITIFLQKGMVFGWTLKTKTKLHKNCMQFFFVHQNFNRTSSDMHKNLRKKWKKSEGKQTLAIYILGCVYIHYYISGTPCWTYPQGSNIIATSNSKFIFSSFLSICARHDQDKWLTYVHANAYKKEAMPQVIMWPWQLSTNRAYGLQT